MTPEQLKASILQSALKGELTVHYTGKEDAKKDYPSLKESKAVDKPYDLPDNWLWIDLKDVATNQNGYAFKPSDWLQSGTKIIRIQNLTDENVSCNYCDESIVDDKYKITKGDVLVSWSCTIDAFLYEGEDAVLNQHIFKIIFDKINVDKKFYIYAIKSLLSTINSKRHGSTMTHITKKDFESMCFPLPPFEEQHRVVQRIEELLPYIDRYTDAYNQLNLLNSKFPEKMQNSILQYAIQGKLVEQRNEEGTAEELYKKIQDEKSKLINAGEVKKEKKVDDIEEYEHPFDIPYNWKWVRLRSLCETDISYGIIKLETEDPLGVKVLRCSDVKPNKIVLDNVRTVKKELSDKYSRTILKGGEVVICVRGTLGGVAVVPSCLAGYNVAREVAVIRPLNGIDAQFLTYLLLSPYFTQFMIGGLRGIAYKGLNMEMLSRFSVPLPPLEEQHRIVDMINKLLPLCDQLS